MKSLRVLGYVRGEGESLKDSRTGQKGEPEDAIRAGGDGIVSHNALRTIHIIGVAH